MRSSEEKTDTLGVLGKKIEPKSEAPKPVERRISADVVEIGGRMQTDRYHSPGPSAPDRKPLVRIVDSDEACD